MACVKKIPVYDWVKKREPIKVPWWKFWVTPDYGYDIVIIGYIEVKELE